MRLLLESGSITASEIGDRLGLSAAGVRRHLDALIETGDAESVPAAPWQQAGRGRPAKRYRLTAAGRGKLDHSYDDLASAAMRQLREIGGEDAVRTFARRRIDAILADVAPADGHDDDAVEAAAERIAGALTKAGYVATTTRVGGPIHGVQICQHHCPVAHVAEEFPELCEAEQQAMAEVLGTHVQRLATIVNGDCACTTHVPLTRRPARAATLRASKERRYDPRGQQDRCRAADPGRGHCFAEPLRLRLGRLRCRRRQRSARAVGGGGSRHLREEERA
ncbi:winged helix-turn-helix DNA-binding family protein [Mycobacterium kansasii]|uniref:Winged helix-turn-helix DNA-binding family protein n=1 Tax=Mycobacterium kansasii TaxID=1768 RepID=A0A1V3WHH7_MYCKA|nr:winged helix-turn-helix DNA-binding family protein [Mycobacterium kansasii]